MGNTAYKKNKFMFSFGTFGRDMVYTMINMFLILYIKELNVSDAILGGVTLIMLLVGIFDAFNDPLMGLLVDNTKTRWGKFKPWIVIGAVASAILTVLLFSDMFGRGTTFLIFFAIFYLLWTVAWTTNDIAYWSMLPSLSKDSGEREVTSSLARIFASLGVFAMVVSIIPVTTALKDSFGTSGSFTVFAASAAAIMLFTQAFTVFGVKERPDAVVKEKTNLRDMVRAIFKNDQLLLCGLALIPFAIGAVTTVSFGPLYFKYVYGDETMFSALAVIMGIASILAIASFPLLCKVLKRKQLFAASMVLLTTGYIMFFLAPANIILIGLAATFLFVGQSLIQTILLVSLADIVEYGEYKLGKRNESVTFSLQAFISKLSGAIASGVVGVTLIISGINSSASIEEVTEQGLWILKIAMFIIPLLLILIGFFIIFFKYKIDEKFYKKIVEELKRRKENEQ